MLARVKVCHRIISKLRAIEDLITAAVAVWPPAHSNQTVRQFLKKDPDLDWAANCIDAGQKLASTLLPQAMID